LVPNIVDLSPQVVGSSNKNALQHDYVVEFSMIIRCNVHYRIPFFPIWGGDLACIWIYAALIAPGPFPTPE
jgi:hypothetical protein